MNQDLRVSFIVVGVFLRRLGAALEIEVIKMQS